MTDASTPIRDLFVSDVTRDIPPVVYFHEQDPAKVAAEVDEYIITGGRADGLTTRDNPGDGIHEQYVRLLNAIADELECEGGPSLPTAWISGFYGSGKSSFAKLLGLALDGLALPDGLSVAEALLRRDRSAKSAEFRAAWTRLRTLIDPIAVVFDIGGVARDDEQIHSAAVRQVQARLGYCATEPLVADFELNLERDGEYARFEKEAEKTLGQPWSEVRTKALAEEDFSHVLSVMYPERYPDPMSWFMARAGDSARKEAPEAAVRAIADMLKYRQPNAHLFLVVDEVSQYVIGKSDRGDRLRAFASALGAHLKGKVWLLALGQQKLDETAGDDFLVWAKDRFPPKLRVHLAPTNIRDVVHKRLLQKTAAATETLRGLFKAHRADLKLFAYGCEAISPDEFAEVYPMLPGQIGLLLEITTALRLRSSRAQGDDQAIRGLLQLLGELFRSQNLADMPVGALVTLDQIYEVQHTALDADTQTSMGRIFDACKAEASKPDGCTPEGAELMVRAAKAVAMLELIQERTPTDAELVAKCLFDHVGCGNNVRQVTDALETLRRLNLVGYSPQYGYKIQSSAAEEWDRDRRDISVPRETISQLVQEGLRKLLAIPDRPRLDGRPFPWAGVFSDGRFADDAKLEDPRDGAVVRVDFRSLTVKERVDSNWVKRSAEPKFKDRLVWLCGDREQLEDLCRKLSRSRRMVQKYKPRRDSLSPARKLLLTQEENNADDHADAVRKAIESTWMAGSMFFRGREIKITDRGGSMSTVLHAAGTEVLRELFPHFDPIQFGNPELEQLLASEIPNGVSPKFMPDALGILELDGGRYVTTCSGLIPRRILEFIEDNDGLSGTHLLAEFGGPPNGYSDSAVKACVLGLLRTKRVNIQPEGGAKITTPRDAGSRDLFLKDRAFKRAHFFPGGVDPVGPQTRARIAKLFKQRLQQTVAREDEPIADAVTTHFPEQARRLRDVESRMRQLPASTRFPEELTKLQTALERCLSNTRRTEQTVVAVQSNLDALSDGLRTLNHYHAELTDDAIEAVNAAHRVLTYELAQLTEMGVDATKLDVIRGRIEEHFKGAKPWVDISGLQPDLDDARAAYRAERQNLLLWQEQQIEAARAQIKRRDGFISLPADQSHSVLRLLTAAQSDTTAEAVAPALSQLKAPFSLRLLDAEDRANKLLDKLLAQRDAVPVVPCALSQQLRHREVRTEQELDAVLNEIRDTIAPLLRDGKHVRIA